MTSGMEKAIKDFGKQFAFRPAVQNARRLKKYERAIIIGMGGSHLGADLIKHWKPERDIVVHSDYGLPHTQGTDRKKTLVILSSYSGNTEEVLDAWRVTRASKLSVAAVSVGGKLLDLAIKAGVPYIELPNTNIQPRMALGFNVMAIAKLIGEEKMVRELSKLAKTLSPASYAGAGKLLAKKLEKKIPVIYASAQNYALAYNWKIKFNETGKIPALYNVLPELNHNEMNSFDAVPKTRALSKNFFFILLIDKTDRPEVQKRMSVLSTLLKAHGFSIELSELIDKNIYKKIFASLLIADWAAYYTALQYGAEPEQVPMVEKFKKMIA